MKEYTEAVKNNIESLFKTNKDSKEVKAYFSKYGVSLGHLQSLINNPDKLYEEDIRLVALIGEQLYIRLGLEALNINSKFNKQELGDIRQFYLSTDNDELIEFPYVIEDVIMISEGCYSFSLSYQLLSKLYNSQKLNYNYDIQRQPKYVRRQD